MFSPHYRKLTKCLTPLVEQKYFIDSYEKYPKLCKAEVKAIFTGI